MQVSYNWLKDFLPELEHSPDTLAEVLTMHIFETKVIGTMAIDPKVIVAQITRLAPHPNADRLRLATITTGVEEFTVVCGAPNINEGDVVPFSPPGTSLYDEQGEGFTLTQATIRGVESPGMLNSPRELGLGNAHSGIYVLPPDTPVGTSLADHLPHDTALEVEVTPNRAHDCLSHRGLAREIAALLALDTNEPPYIPIPDGTPADWKLKIEAPEAVSRYFLIPVTKVNTSPSPLWLQARLWAVGSRPINNVVDITNFVTFELGNPTHAFDSHKIPGRIITVRQAKTQEKLITLDEEERQLKTGDIVITSADEPLALAGISGGGATEVEEETTEILLEVASFAGYPIQQTSARLRLYTESSTRFAKGISPSLAGDAASRTVQLLREIAGGSVNGLIEYYPHPAAPLTITMHPERVTAMAGTSITPEQSRRALTHLRCSVEERGKTWHVTPPLERLDLVGEHDLIEEVIRLQGLDAIPASPIEIQTMPALPRKVQLREMIRDCLVTAGLTETYNRPFEHERFSRALLLDNHQALELVNPVAPEQSHLRTSLLPGLLANLVTNKGEVRKKKSSGSRNIFEVGSVWEAGENGLVPGIKEEEWVSGLLLEGLAAHDLVQDIFTALGLSGVVSADLWRAGSIDTQTLTSLRLPTGIQFFEINLEQLIVHLPDNFAYELPRSETALRYKIVSKYPPIVRDLSLLVDPDLPLEAAQEIIERTGGELVADVDLFDEYQPAGSDKKGLAFRITYQSPERTLTANEVAQVHNTIVASLQREIDAELRE